MSSLRVRYHLSAGVARGLIEAPLAMIRPLAPQRFPRAKARPPNDSPLLSLPNPLMRAPDASAETRSIDSRRKAGVSLYFIFWLAIVLGWPLFVTFAE